MGLKSTFGPEENGGSHDSSGAYPIPRHTDDAPYPGSGGTAPRPAETEEQVEKRAFIFSAWLDGLTPDAIKKLWKKRQSEESSS